MTENMKTDINEATTPQNIVIPVKFNKEIKELSLEEATLLAQKGMKLDLIADELELLKNLSEQEGKSVSQFLKQLQLQKNTQLREKLMEKCSGDEELVEKIISLDNNQKSDIKGFDEVKQYFPNIKSTEDLPEAVVEAAKLKGTFLLDEYLRYFLAQKKRQEKSIKNQQKAENLSLGSQLNRSRATSIESEEFIKGLWK